MLSFIQQIRKTVYIQTILPTIAYISNKSGASGVQHFLTPLSPSAPFYTHARKQINVASYHVLKSFSSTKSAAVLRLKKTLGRGIRRAVPPALPSPILMA